MRRYLYLVSLMVMAALLLGARPAEAAACRPFKLKGTAQFSNLIFDNGNLVSATATGSGTATRLGHFTAVGLNQFSPPQDGLVLVDAVVTFTAANGDLLVATFNDAVLDLATGTATGTYVFTGGTGRFEGASPSSSTPHAGYSLTRTRSARTALRLTLSTTSVPLVSPWCQTPL